jgi:ribosomal protein S27E
MKRQASGRLGRALRDMVEGWRAGVGPGRYRSTGDDVRCERCGHERFVRGAGGPGNAGLLAWLSGAEWPLRCERCGHTQRVLDPVRVDADD